MSVHAIFPHSPRIKTIQAERRRSPRFRCIREITCQAAVAGKEASAPAILEDLSTTGMRLVVRRHYEAGRILAVAWQHPVDGSKRSLLARVVHARNDGTGNWIVGCAFANALSQEELTALL